MGSREFVPTLATFGTCHWAAGANSGRGSTDTLAACYPARQRKVLPLTNTSSRLMRRRTSPPLKATMGFRLMRSAQQLIQAPFTVSRWVHVSVRQRQSVEQPSRIARLDEMILVTSFWIWTFVFSGPRALAQNVCLLRERGSAAIDPLTRPSLDVLHQLQFTLRFLRHSATPDAPRFLP